MKIAERHCHVRWYFLACAYWFWNFNGLVPTIFLKKLLKCATSVKPSAKAISDTFH